MREVIGQVLTHTLPDSAAEQQAHYDEYLKSLVNTHVLWAVVPCPPPNPGARDRRRYANDLRITLAYLREALRLRSLEQPVAVALVLSKIDTLFKDAEEARAALTDDVLRTSLGPLVHLIEQVGAGLRRGHHPRDGVRLRQRRPARAGGEREGAPPESADEPFGAEPIWLLREGVCAAALQPRHAVPLDAPLRPAQPGGAGVLEEESETRPALPDAARGPGRERPLAPPPQGRESRGMAGRPRRCRWPVKIVATVRLRADHNRLGADLSRAGVGAGPRPRGFASQSAKPLVGSGRERLLHDLGHGRLSDPPADVRSGRRRNHGPAGLFQTAAGSTVRGRSAGLKQPSLRTMTSETLGRRITALMQSIELDLASRNLLGQQ